MAKQNIEKILAIVSAVEANDEEAGVAVRRVVEQAENDWNDHPTNLDANKESIVRKMLDADDLRAAALRAGLATNENVLAFINVIQELPEPPKPTDRELEEMAKAEADRKAEQETRAKVATDLMSRAVQSVNVSTEPTE